MDGLPRARSDARAKPIGRTFEHLGAIAWLPQALIDELRERGCNPVIGTNPTHPSRELDRDLYRERFQVENFFQRIKRFRRISMRFEKLAANYLAFVYLAAILVWLL